MLRPKKIRLLLAFAIALAGVSLIVAIMVKVDQGPSTAAKNESLPGNIEMALQKVHYSEVKDGAAKWDLFADQALFDKTKQAFHLKNVRLVLTAEKRVGNITLTADRADYHSESKNVELFGHVIAKSDSGLQFSTEQAAYISGRSLIRTDSPVRFTDGKIDVQGIGMEFMTATRDLKVMKDVTADIETGPGTR